VTNPHGAFATPIDVINLLLKFFLFSSHIFTDGLLGLARESFSFCPDYDTWTILHC
jgi:hypothetical protein